MLGILLLVFIGKIFSRTKICTLTLTTLSYTKLFLDLGGEHKANLLYEKWTMVEKLQLCLHLLIAKSGALLTAVSSLHLFSLLQMLLSYNKKIDDKLQEYKQVSDCLQEKKIEDALLKIDCGLFVFWYVAINNMIEIYIDAFLFFTPLTKH